MGACNSRPLQEPARRRQATDCPSFAESAGSANASAGLQPPSKKVLCIRHCHDETLGDADRCAATLFSRWHTAEYRAANQEHFGNRDPCLTEQGVLEAGAGIADENLRNQLNLRGYGGVDGGLCPVAAAFRPQLVVCSPVGAAAPQPIRSVHIHVYTHVQSFYRVTACRQLARAVQTAIVAFAQCPGVPIIVHRALAEMKPDLTGGGKWPRGKPGCQGLPKSELRQALDRVGATHVDLSGIEEENWFGPHDSEQVQCARVAKFTDWIQARPEVRIAVVSHGGVLREVSHMPLLLSELHRVVLTRAHPQYSCMAPEPRYRCVGVRRVACGLRQWLDVRVDHAQWKRARMPGYDSNGQTSPWFKRTQTLETATPKQEAGVKPTMIP